MRKEKDNKKYEYADTTRIGDLQYSVLKTLFSEQTSDILKYLNDNLQQMRRMIDLQNEHIDKYKKELEKERKRRQADIAKIVTALTDSKCVSGRNIKSRKLTVYNENATKAIWQEKDIPSDFKDVMYWDKEHNRIKFYQYDNKTKFGWAERNPGIMFKFIKHKRENSLFDRYVRISPIQPQKYIGHVVEEGISQEIINSVKGKVTQLPDGLWIYQINDESEPILFNSGEGIILEKEGLYKGEKYAFINEKDYKNYYIFEDTLKRLDEYFDMEAKNKLL